VDEHSGGDIASSTQIAYSSGYQDLSSVPTTVTWTIPAVTFRRGYGYSFRVGRDPATCRYARQTTWAHNAPTINGGNARCTLGPPASPYRYPLDLRMWHSTGASDRQADCVSNAAGFDSTMPTGWLVTNGTHVMRAITWASPPPAQTACGAANAAGGARVVYWRASPSDPTQYSDYVCMWPQYEGLEQTNDHGWYYGIPWKDDNTGAPRDAYIKPETIDYDALLQSHAPILKYDSGESFHVLSPGALTDFYIEGGIHDWSNTLKDGQGEFAIASPAFGESLGWDLDLLSLDYLGPTYDSSEIPPSRRANTPADSSDFVSARGDTSDGNYDDDARFMEMSIGYPFKVYGRATHGGDGKLWLQYWFFYYFNPDPTGFLGADHEGDWEMIQIGLNSDTTPDTAVYAQHNTRQSCPWASVERAGDIPVVYVGQYSHASFFAPDQLPFPFEIYDRADGQGGGLYQPDLEPIGEASPSWTAWRGKWGDSGSSPAGPKFQPGEKWSNPSGWASGAPSC
jgi:hypothetical protein